MKARPNEAFSRFVARNGASPPDCDERFLLETLALNEFLYRLSGCQLIAYNAYYK